MLRIYADKYILLGELLADARVLFELDENFEEIDGERKLNENGRKDCSVELCRLLNVSKQLELTFSKALIESRIPISNVPETEEAFNILVDAVRLELKNRLFLFVPPHRAEFYEMDSILSAATKIAFPTPYEELREAGNCLAAGMNSATVFHAMRAAEIGVRAFGSALGVAFPSHPLELADWQNILEQSESKIGDMRKLPKGTHKDEELYFYSQAAIQFRYFKDGWRVRAMHGRATYSEPQAKEILNHVRDFFESLAGRLKEQQP